MKQEITDLDLDKYAKALLELRDYFERAKSDKLDLEQFISTAQDVLDDLDMAILDEYGYMPLLLKDDLAERYQDYINQAKRLIGGITNAN